VAGRGRLGSSPLAFVRDSRSDASCGPPAVTCGAFPLRVEGGEPSLALGFKPMGGRRGEVDYRSPVSHNCLELLLGCCKHTVINSWAQCLERLGEGSVRNAKKHRKHASVETSLVPRGSPSGAGEGCWMSLARRHPSDTRQPRGLTK